MIETLPVELLHRIFDNLDAETILLSIRPVCRLFRSVVKTYDRYVLDFKLISKTNFYILCRLINPQNVISLIFLEDKHTPDRIDLFFSLVRLEEFTRLRSLTLRNIDEGQLNIILERIHFDLLTSFSLNIGKYDDKCTETTRNLLSSIIAKQSLRKLELNVNIKTLWQISWPIDCFIQYLTLNNSVLIDDLYPIFQSSPHLHTLNLSKIPTTAISNLSSIRFRQLTSLTITDVHESIDHVESFLLLTPSLVHLKLIGGKQMLDGKRWEQFIDINLSLLIQFEFYFVEERLTQQTPTDIELMLASFQTSFWIEHKKWFVTCECLREYPETIHLSSIPFCTSSVYYISKSEKISLSTYPGMINNDLPTTENISLLWLILSKSTADDIAEKKLTTNQPLFPKVTKIDLEFREDWPLFSLQSLFVFIDILRIVKMKISSKYFNKYNENTWMDISIFMKQAYNLSSLIFQGNFNELHQTTKTNIYSILPHHINCLEIPIDELDQIKMILERCENLFTIEFDFDDENFSKKIINWFAENTINTTCRESCKTVTVWLGKKIKQSTD